MCKYCGATQIEEVNGRVICSYCKSPQLDIKPVSVKSQYDKYSYIHLFNGCVTLEPRLIEITPSIINQ